VSKRLRRSNSLNKRLFRPSQTAGPTAPKIPSFQVHEYNADFYILRGSGCLHAEKPFLYLLFGSKRALLFDTGAGGESRRHARDQRFGSRDGRVETLGRASEAQCAAARRRTLALGQASPSGLGVGDWSNAASRPWRLSRRPTSHRGGLDLEGDIPRTCQRRISV
jgi:hypothetical protein